MTATFTASAKILSIAHSTARKNSESGHLLVSCRQVLVFEGLVLITMLKAFFSSLHALMNETYQLTGNTAFCILPVHLSSNNQGFSWATRQKIAFSCS